MTIHISTKSAKNPKSICFDYLYIIGRCKVVAEVVRLDQD